MEKYKFVNYKVGFSEDFIKNKFVNVTEQDIFKVLDILIDYFENNLSEKILKYIENKLTVYIGVNEGNIGRYDIMCEMNDDYITDFKVWTKIDSDFEFSEKFTWEIGNNEMIGFVWFEGNVKDFVKFANKLI